MFCHGDQRSWVSFPEWRGSQGTLDTYSAAISHFVVLQMQTFLCLQPCLNVPDMPGTLFPLCLALPFLPSSFRRPMQVPLTYHNPACMSLSPRSHLWPPPGKNSSPNVYPVRKSRVQGLWPDGPGSHPGSCTPRGMTAVPWLSYVHHGHSGSFLRFLGG